MTKQILLLILVTLLQGKNTKNTDGLVTLAKGSREGRVFDRRLSAFLSVFSSTISQKQTCHTNVTQ